MTSWLAGNTYGVGSGFTSAAASTARATGVKAPTGDKATTGAAAAPSGQAKPQSEVQISREARVALAEAADNKKSTDVVRDESRKALDEQYAKSPSSKASPDLSEMSGRALATITLDDGARFSRAEVFAAKKELNERTRTELVTAIRIEGLGAGLVSYGKTMLASSQGMSAEERQARGWTDQVRQSALQYQKLTGSSLLDFLA